MNEIGWNELTADQKIERLRDGVRGVERSIMMVRISLEEGIGKALRERDEQISQLMDRVAKLEGEKS